MRSSRNDDFQPGSLRIRVSADGTFDLVRYNGHDWIPVENSRDPLLQDAMHAAVPAAQPGFYAPTPWMGFHARILLKAA